MARSLCALLAALGAQLGTAQAQDSGEPAIFRQMAGKTFVVAREGQDLTLVVEALPNAAPTLRAKVLIQGRTGDPAYAVSAGTVTFAGMKGSEGNQIVIDHGGGVETRYSHLHRFAAGMTTGARVTKGQVIGDVGTTGRSVRPNLGLTIAVPVTRANPLSMIHAMADQFATGWTPTVAQAVGSHLSNCLDGLKGFENGAFDRCAVVETYQLMRPDGDVEIRMRHVHADGRASYDRFLAADTAIYGAEERSRLFFSEAAKSTPSSDPRTLFAEAEAAFRRPTAVAAVSSAVTQPVPAPPSAGQAPPPAVKAVPTGPRLALVVANGRYGASLGVLTNPRSDARIVAAGLRQAGFEVVVVEDAGQRVMKQAIAQFGQRLAAAGKEATGLFYFAGHGVQTGGTNYLIPVDAAIEKEADIDLDAIAADTVLSQMEAASIATSIVILDACRNMPFARSSRSATRGLARMEAPSGSYVAYSTAPGQVAADGSGTNSPFAAAFVREIGRTGQPIEIVFRNVRKAVAEATGGRQTPWESSSLFDDFVFTPSR